MTVDNYQGKMLQNSIESIVIREKEFESLKQIINELYENKSSSKKMKEIIIKKLIQYRLRIIRELLNFISFHFKQEPKSQKIKNFTENSRLKKDLEERNEFLKIIDHKIEAIYKKLSEKHKK